MRCVSRRCAFTSGGVFGRFLFAILILQELSDPHDFLVRVREQPHDSGHILVLDRRLHASIVLIPSRRHKTLIAPCQGRTNPMRSYIRSSVGADSCRALSAPRARRRRSSASSSRSSRYRSWIGTTTATTASATSVLNRP
jgi:hypothetical protein